MRTVSRFVGCIALGAALLASPARADDFYDSDDSDHAQAYDPNAEFALGIGYTRISLDGGGPLLEGRDGIHLNPVVSFAPFAALPQLRLGAAVGWSIALDDPSGATVVNDGQVFVVTASDVTFMLVEPELRLSWRQPFGEDDAFFIEPGVAGGAALGWLDVGSDDDDTPDVADANAFDDWDSSFQWKVFLRAGARVPTGIAGIEASYMTAGELEFADNLRGEPGEFYFGVFGALRF